MSNHLVNQVKAHSQAKGLTRMVLWAIADRINGDNGAWSIGYGLIAKDCGIDRRTAMRAVLRLETMGELTATRTKASGSENYRNLYQVTVGGSGTQTLPSVTESPPRGRETLGVVSESHQGSVTESPSTQRNQHKPNITGDVSKFQGVTEPDEYAKKVTIGLVETDWPHFRDVVGFASVNDAVRHYMQTPTDMKKERLALGQITEIRNEPTPKRTQPRRRAARSDPKPGGPT